VIKILGPKIHTENRIVKNAALIISENKIHAIDIENVSVDDTISFPENYHVVPGFIDIHIHGANNVDVMDGTFTALQTLSEALAAEGTTSYLATTMTASSSEIDKAVKNVGDYLQTQQTISGAQILGIHLEGPFLSPEKVGAQDAKNILAPQLNYIREWQKISANAIKLVTLAPELPNSLELIHFLKTQKIIASIGHTNATYAETLAAIDAGCSHVTHLFNAMRHIHHREPGVAIAALLSEKLSTELILDGIHLHKAMVELVLKTKNKEKIILVTDAMRAKCLAEGSYDLGGQTVYVKNNVASLADGTLAGSVLKMCSAIQMMTQLTSLTDAIRFAAENPAKLLNIFHRKGSIAAGKDADLVVLDDTLNVVLTMVMGKIVYQKNVK
jgi:N-acetylglucosamine-6-phosphate deacetylase